MQIQELLNNVKLATLINNGELELEQLDYEDRKDLENAMSVALDMVHFSKLHGKDLSIWRNRENILGEALRWW